MEIRLEKIRLYGYHGLHTGEEILGGEFEVNLTVHYSPVELPVQNLSDTVDYTALYELVKTRMQKPALLLETLVTEIAAEILAKFSLVEEVNISIYKLHPPIPHFQGSVGVAFTLKRNP